MQGEGEFGNFCLVGFDCFEDVRGGEAEFAVAGGGVGGGALAGFGVLFVAWFAGGLDALGRFDYFWCRFAEATLGVALPASLSAPLRAWIRFDDENWFALASLWVALPARLFTHALDAHLLRLNYDYRFAQATF